MLMYCYRSWYSLVVGTPLAICETFIQPQFQLIGEDRNMQNRLTGTD